MDPATARRQEGKGSPRDPLSQATNGGAQAPQDSWQDAKAFYDNLSPQKKPKSVSEIFPPAFFPGVGMVGREEVKFRSPSTACFAFCCTGAWKSGHSGWMQRGKSIL